MFKFKKTQRLLNASDYKQVFDYNGAKVANSSLLILAKPSVKYPSRLGLVVAKKNIPTAVQRNRIKRVARETFRKKQFQSRYGYSFYGAKGADKLSAKKLTAIMKSLGQSWTIAVRCKVNKMRSLLIGIIKAISIPFKSSFWSKL